MLPAPFPLPPRLKLLLLLGAAGVAAVFALPRLRKARGKRSSSPASTPPGSAEWLQRVDVPTPRVRAFSPGQPTKARRGARASRPAAKSRRGAPSSARR